MVPLPRPSGPALRQRIIRLGLTFVVAATLGAAFAIANLSVRTVNAIIHPKRQAIVETPATHGLPFEAVTFPSADGTTLRGWFVPGNSRATIVLTHGLWGNREGNLDEARWLRERADFSLLLFDFRASGESDGDTVTFGYHESDDLLAAAAYLASRPDVDARRLGAYGESFGAGVVILAAGRSPVFQAVVADSPFTSVESMIATSFRGVTGMPAFPFAPIVTWLGERETGLKPAQIAPLEVVGRISPTPLLLIHGALDHLIPVGSSFAHYEAANEPKELWIVENAGHAGAYGADTEAYEERVAGFFRRHLK